MANIYSEVNNLEKTIFIGGTQFIFTFKLWDENGSPLNVSAGTCKWVLCPYGDPNYAVITKTTANGGISIIASGGINEPSQMIVTLTVNDTLSLSGEFIQQPIITDFYGKTFRPGQGIVIIKPAIKSS